MSAVLSEACLPPVLKAARAAGRAAGLPYAGSLPPQAAWALVQDGAATLVDVRSAEECRFVGQVPGADRVPWATGLKLERNTRFVEQLEATIDKDAVVLLLCRSGKRSALAAEAATDAGFAHAFSILEGFEGELNASGQRGADDGWRFRGLPWTQD
ncbi:MAG: rhodanese-like domain-containing protein [Burkholderiaceae bacterium]